MSERSVFGLIGIGTMGSNLALNLEDHGIPVAFWNLEAERTKAFAAANPDRDFLPTSTFEELVGAVDRPRRILMMIPAGDPVDATLSKLVPLLDAGVGSHAGHDLGRLFRAPLERRLVRGQPVQRRPPGAGVVLEGVDDIAKREAVDPGPGKLRQTLSQLRDDPLPRRSAGVDQTGQ